MNETNHPSHDQIAYESWLRRHELATVGTAAGATETAKQGTR